MVEKQRIDAASGGGVINTPRGIAEQINLLAPNAASEGTRAVERGRSAAAVADEVRARAQRCVSSDDEIERIVYGLQIGAPHAVAATRQDCDRIRGTVGEAAASRT